MTYVILKTEDGSVQIDFDALELMYPDERYVVRSTDSTVRVNGKAMQTVEVYDTTESQTVTFMTGMHAHYFAIRLARELNTAFESVYTDITNDDRIFNRELKMYVRTIVDTLPIVEAHLKRRRSDLRELQERDGFNEFKEMSIQTLKREIFGYEFDINEAKDALSKMHKGLIKLYGLQFAKLVKEVGFSN